MTNTMSLVEILNELLVSEQLQLPVFPPLALEVQKMLACDDADFDKISAKIAGDLQNVWASCEEGGVGTRKNGFVSQNLPRWGLVDQSGCTG